MARPKLGDSESKRLQMVITEDELTAIDDWRFAQRVATRSEAIRRLCRVALIHEELRPSINKNMKGLVDATMLLSDVTLEERSRSPEELEEMRGLASDIFKHCYALYDKLIEQTVRVSALTEGGEDIRKDFAWEKRAAEFLDGKSLLDETRKSAEARKVIEDAVKERTKSNRDLDK